MFKKVFAVMVLVFIVQYNYAQIKVFGDSTLISKPKMQIVFALDATGSMTGLISAAKDKIWSIINGLNQTSPLPEIQIGLVFYRDRGDDFVTKIIPLTDSIDFVYTELMKINASGGGDGPESVNQGLYEAVEKMKWNKDTTTYKTVFLIGDFEPHMDYKNDVPYFVTCKIAKSKDIVLNTILMGNNEVAKKVWQEIAICNQGSYVNVNMSLNDLAINTPYDSTIAAISDKLDGMKYYYGSFNLKAIGALAISKSKEVTNFAKANVKAQRAEYNYTYNVKMKAKAIKQNELLEDIKNNQIVLDSLIAKKEELPEEFKSKTNEEIKLIINTKIKEQDSLQKNLQKQIALRNSYIEEALIMKDKKDVSESFNNVIYKNIQKQTNKKNITLIGNAKF